MGTQCKILLSYYTEKGTEEKEIRAILDLKEEDKGEVNSVGGRGWENGLTEFFISIKNWNTIEIKKFIRQLRKVNWQFPGTVQVYYCPEALRNYTLYTYVKLFPKIDGKPTEPYFG